MFLSARQSVDEKPSARQVWPSRRAPLVLLLGLLTANEVPMAVAQECHATCPPDSTAVCLTAILVDDQALCKTDSRHRLTHHRFKGGTAVPSLRVGLLLEPFDRLSYDAGLSSETIPDVALELLCPNGSNLQFSGDFDVVVKSQDPDFCAIDLQAGRGDVQCGGSTGLSFNEISLGCKGTRFAADSTIRSASSLARILVFEGDVTAVQAGDENGVLLGEGRAYSLSPQAGGFESGPIEEREFESTASLYARLDVAKITHKRGRITDRAALVSQFKEAYREVLTNPSGIDSIFPRARLGSLRNQYGLGRDNSLETDDSSADAPREKDHSGVGQPRAPGTPPALGRHRSARSNPEPPRAGEWAQWRGPHQNGVSSETGLISNWSVDGENLIWRVDFAGRSTAAVFDGRACAIGRDGEDILRQEVVVCWSAEDGTRLWQRRFTPHNTFVPWSRIGWASVAGDSETGLLYAHTSDGLLIALDRTGETVWQWRLAEDIGRMSGYGGRTHTPIIDEDRVILAAIGSSWGNMDVDRMRYWAFDKYSGEVLFVAEPSPRTRDSNTQSTPVVSVVDGQRMLIGANSDGYIYAMQARTGKKLWAFQLSEVSLNSGVAVAGGRVFASHSEENVDVGTMGRMVGIDAASGEEVWRIPDLKAGFGTPLVHGGRVYLVDNSANLNAVDAATGEVQWVHNIGTVGKSGPVWADGKIYVTEVNGRFHILKDAGDHAEVLDTDVIMMSDEGRAAEIYASPAIAYGRIYFATENGFFCLGDKSKPFEVKPSQPVDWGEKPKMDGAEPALIHVVPAAVVTTTAEELSFRVRAFDDAGHFLGEMPASSWSLDGLDGEVSGDGAVTLKDAQGLHVGYVVARLGDLEARARVRAAGLLPWTEDFESLPAGDFPKGGFPKGWLGRRKKATVREIDGNHVLEQPDPKFFAPRAVIYIGPSWMNDYTIWADVFATERGRRKPELGLINSGYTCLIAGIQQRMEIRSWGSELRMMQRQNFAWETGTWYSMKLRVDIESDGQGREIAAVRCKAWKRYENEPPMWTLTVRDPLPIRQGAAGLYAYTPVNGYFDNVVITASE